MHGGRNSKERMKQWIGQAIFILALCLGIGGCDYLEKSGEAKVINAKAEAERQGKEQR